MSAPTLVPPVVGDGTSARTRATSRWRRARVPLAIGAALVVVALLAALPEPRTSQTPLAPDSTGPAGARAAARVLGRQGVHVEYVRRLAQVLDHAHPGTTLLVAGDAPLDEEQVRALRGTGADLALVDADWALSVLTDAVSPDAAAPHAAEREREAECDDPDAVAAGTITAGGSLAVTGAATACFPPDGAAPGSAGAYVVVPGSPRIAALSDPTPLRNDHLAQVGNAALVLRMLGRHDTLVWYVPQAEADDATSVGPALRDLVPPQVPLAGLAALLVVVVAALWRGRRLGRLVSEPLPVVVRAGETTRGRGRLYRRARARGHAAAALRAGAASRCAARLGLPRSADAAALVAAIAHATGRDDRAVGDLLYGPPPTDDRALTRLARALDDLESEVHHP